MFLLVRLRIFLLIGRMRFVIAAALLIFSGCDPDWWPWHEPTPKPVPNAKRIDLRSKQTPIRNQGGRTTCITFAALAGLEAAYLREGYGALDLSEEFLNHSGKMFWLHPNWSTEGGPGAQIGAELPSFRENQVGAFGGGGGAGYIEALAKGHRVVAETLMPYQPWGHDRTIFPELQYPWYDAYWDAQIAADDFNLHPHALKQGALLAEATYAVEDYRTVNARSAADIEASLTQGYEVVWDFLVEGTDEPVWRTCRERPDRECRVLGGHAVVIVGYDRTAADAKDHYLIIKNSWGPTSTPGADGFTYVSYDYLQNGYAAASVRRVSPPAPRPEHAMLGRWRVQWSGSAEIFDLYHMPGVAQPYFDAERLGITDRRVGTAFRTGGSAWRINGTLAGARATLWLSDTEPNLRWDVTAGHRLELTLSGDGLTLAGLHYPPGSSTALAVIATRVQEVATFRALGTSMRPMSPAREVQEREPLPLLGRPFLPWLLLPTY